MSTPATYNIFGSFFYMLGDNEAPAAALRFKDMLTLFNAPFEDSYAGSFVIVQHPEVCYRSSHEQDNDTTYRYTLGPGLRLLAETVYKTRGTKKTKTRPFFKGCLQEFIHRYTPSPSLTTGLYKIQDERFQEGLWFSAKRGNSPCEAAYRLGLMNILQRSKDIAYSLAFDAVNEDVKSYSYPSSPEFCSDYLSIVEPSEDEERFILKAYQNSNNPILFFEGPLEGFIKLYGKN